MARITDFTTLKAAVADTLNREDLANSIPGMIQDAEAMFSREIRYRSMLRRDTVTADEEYENLPADFLQLKTIQFLSNPPVVPELFTPEALAGVRADQPNLMGVPRRYAIVGIQLRFDRTPASVPLEITSYTDIPSLSDDVPTNELLLDAPDIYKYGTLMMAEVYLKNDARLPTWTAMYQSARDALHRMDRMTETRPGALQRRHRRVF